MGVFGFQIGSESGDSGGARPEPCRVVSREIRGGHTLLLGAVRFAGSVLRRGERGAARGGAAAAVKGDSERAGGGGAVTERRGEVQQLEREVSAVGVPGGVFGRECGGSGNAAARNVPLRWVHLGGGQRRTQAGLEGSLLAHCFCMEATSPRTIKKYDKITILTVFYI